VRRPWLLAVTGTAQCETLLYVKMQYRTRVVSYRNSTRSIRHFILIAHAVLPMELYSTGTAGAVWHGLNKEPTVYRTIHHTFAISTSYSTALVLL
jgi:hypothetical protein